jgi:FkbM family methyltransferase
MIETRYGPFRVIDTDLTISKSIKLYGEWAQIEIELLANFISPGDVVIDAGAFIGTHTVAFSALVGPAGSVISFEPRKAFARILKENSRRTRYQNIDIRVCALGAAPEILKVPLVDLSDEMNFGSFSLRHPQNGPAKEVASITTLDSLDLARLNLIKADVEGMEIDILRGAERTVQRFRPIVFAETNLLHSSLPLLDWAKCQNYTAFGVLTSAFNPDNYKKNSENFFGEATEAGVLMLPNERVSTYFGVIQANRLPSLSTADDLALLLLHKAQYPSEILARTETAKVLGLDYPSPLASRQAALFQEYESALTHQQQQVESLQEILSAESSKIQAGEQRLSDLTAAIADRDSALAGAEQRLNDLTTAIADRDSAHAAEEKLIQDFRHTIAEANARVIEQSSTILALNEALFDNEVATVKLKAELSIHRRLLNERETALADRDSQLTSALNALAERDDTIRQRNQQIETIQRLLLDRSEVIDTLEREILLRNQQLFLMTSSRSWRITKLLRIAAKTARTLLNKNSTLASTESPTTAPKISDSNQASSDLLQIAIDVLKPHFDTQFYLMEYREVAESGMDPIEHYLKVGANSLMDPSPTFSTKYYLDTNPDLKAAGVNPFQHFVTIGRHEGRLPQLPGGFRVRHLEQLRPLEETVRGWYGLEQQFAPCSFDALCSTLEAKLAGVSQAILCFSHDDYTKSVGGVQHCLLIEQEAFDCDRTAYLNFHPAQPLPILAPINDHSRLMLNVMINGVLIGALQAGEIGRALKRFAKRVDFVLAVHALHGHAPESVTHIAEAARAQRAFFWIHDYFSMCPGYNLLRNGISYCGAPPVDSPACNVCVFGESRRGHVTRVRQMFETLSLTVVAPSESALEIWEAHSGLSAQQTLIHPHCTLDTATLKTLSVSSSDKDPLRIAFLGYLDVHKGWPVFERLLKRFGGNPRYEFYYLGKGSPEYPNLKVTNVAVTTESRTAMIDAISKNRIDFALIWSLWPETFSFVSFEALAAGAQILTYRDAGNVARLVSQTGAGRVFDNEDELVSFIETGDAKLKSCETPRLVRQLTFNRMTADILSVASNA